MMAQSSHESVIYRIRNAQVQAKTFFIYFYHYFETTYETLRQKLNKIDISREATLTKMLVANDKIQEI